MAKFVKNTKTIDIVDLSEKELISLLKINVNCLLAFMKDNEVISYIILSERFEENGINKITVSTLLDKNKEISYTELFEMIRENTTLGILTAKIDIKVFKEKEPLLLMLDTLKESIVNSCVYIDYLQKNNIFFILNKKKGNLNDKLYYFEDNNSILAFSEIGPILVYGKTQSVEDVICD